MNKEQFKSSLSVLESERHSLLESLRELEKKHESLKDKNQEFMRSLNYQAEHITSLETEKGIMTDKIKQLQNKIFEFENIHSSMMQERGSLKASIELLQEENEKFKSLYDGRESFIQKLANSYGEEKETILGVHHKHSKLLSSKILIESVAKIVFIRKN